eukprot:Rmarinus@m.9459
MWRSFLFASPFLRAHNRSHVTVLNVKYVSGRLFASRPRLTFENDDSFDAYPPLGQDTTTISTQDSGIATTPLSIGAAADKVQSARREKRDRRKRVAFALEKNDVRETVCRSGGPGGQHVNKTNTCVIVKHIPTGIIVRCQQERSQSVNRKIAWKLLRDKVELHLLGENSKLGRKQEALKEKNRKKKQRSKKRAALRMAGVDGPPSEGPKLESPLSPKSGISLSCVSKDLHGSSTCNGSLSETEVCTSPREPYR